MRVSSILAGIVFGSLFIASLNFQHKSVASIPTAGHVVIDQTELECLAKNIYFEARGESLAGMLAVGLVTKNRKNDIRYPSTYCGVVTQGPVRESWKGGLYPVRYKCQFTWYCDGKPDTIRNEDAWERVLQVAEAVMRGRVYDFTDGATHYHTKDLNDPWGFRKVAVIDRHIFYKRP